uniref:Uncharacterized protein n=1 Tax=Fagus sylvatica TaxID=28930 RepID=A0A2N9HFS4_FAGSY
MVKALSARVFIRVFEVCWSLVLIPPNGGSRNHHRPVCVYSPHIVSRLPFVFGCASFHFCDSAARFLVCRARRWQRWQLSVFTFPPSYLFTFGWNFALLASLPLLLSLVCCAEKPWQRSLVPGGCSSRAPSEITLYPLTSPWAGLIIGDLWQIAPNKSWALQQTGFSCNNTVPPGPIVGYCALGFLQIMSPAFLWAYCR